jgi:hypothetical protein
MVVRREAIFFEMALDAMPVGDVERVAVAIAA